jgi:GT2 family glycosyltransferase
MKWYFFFLEETDLCVRVRQAGYEVVFFPETKIIHLQGKTVRKSWINGRMEYNISLHKFYKKALRACILQDFRCRAVHKSLVFPSYFFRLFLWSTNAIKIYLLFETHEVVPQGLPGRYGPERSLTVCTS